VVFAGELYQVSNAEREKKAKQILEMFGLYEKKKWKAKGLSKGMKRWLSFAMGLVRNPQLLHSLLLFLLLLQEVMVIWFVEI
jgi:ABC-2 type transport system ATP-binding protein